VITKHPGTGGLVSVGTVTAQLLYEIGAPGYANPDVVAHFDTIQVSQQDINRVQIRGTRGSPPTGQLKVAIDYIGGYRNTMTLVLTGLDIEAKAAAAEAQLFDVLGGKDQYDDVDVRLLRFDRPDAPTNAQATAHLQITVKDRDRDRVGRRFSNATMELFLGGYAGFHTTTPPTDATDFGVYWPALIPAFLVTQRLVLPDGSVRVIEHTAPADTAAAAAAAAAGTGSGRADSLAGGPACPAPDASSGPAGMSTGTARGPLGLVCGARSGDKGGNANIGLWVRTPAEYEWLRDYLTVERFRELLTESAELAVRRYELPNLLAVNFVIVGLLGNGVADSTRPDPQAKGLGEYLRSRHVDLPTAWLAGAGSLPATPGTRGLRPAPTAATLVFTACHFPTSSRQRSGRSAPATRLANSGSWPPPRTCSPATDFTRSRWKTSVRRSGSPPRPSTGTLTARPPCWWRCSSG
jgi:hypothetical protein